MRISDWSSDVCSSDLDKGADVYFVLQHASHDVGCPNLAHRMLALLVVEPTRDLGHFLSADRVVAKDPLHHFDLGRRSQGVDYFISAERLSLAGLQRQARKSVVWGKSGSGSVDLGGRRINKKKKSI